MERIAKANSNKWIFCIDMFPFSPERVADPDREREFRKVVRDVVKKLEMPRLVYVDGKKMLTGATGLTIDLVHPSPSGMEEIASNLSRLISKQI